MEIIRYVGQYLRGTRAIAAMEYAIIVGVVVVGVGLGVSAFSTEIQSYLTAVTTEVGNLPVTT